MPLQVIFADDRIAYYPAAAGAYFEPEWVTLWGHTPEDEERTVAVLRAAYVLGVEFVERPAGDPPGGWYAPASAVGGVPPHP